MATYRHNWGEDRAYFYDDRGVLVSIPANWTSLVSPDPWVTLAAGRSLFRLPDLRELARLLKQMASERR